jgi:hypothetical protein
VRIADLEGLSRDLCVQDTGVNCIMGHILSLLPILHARQGSFIWKIFAIFMAMGVSGEMNFIEFFIHRPLTIGAGKRFSRNK